MMGRYISTAPRVKKQQVFTVSGTFTPSPGLLAAGGSVTVQCVGGGGGGGVVQGAAYSAGGGSGENKTRIVSVTAPVSVIVGAGGAAAWAEVMTTQSTPKIHPGTDGGITSFGNLVIARGGGCAFASLPGTAGGEGGFYGEPGGGVSGYHLIYGGGGGPGGGIPTMETEKSSGFANTGGGGGGRGGVINQGPHQHAGNGGSGICIVTWEE